MLEIHPSILTDINLKVRLVEIKLKMLNMIVQSIRELTKI